MAWLGMARWVEVRRGNVRYGKVWQGMGFGAGSGVERFGMAWRGLSRRGMARHGVVRQGV